METISPGDDLRQRWLPSAEQVAAGVAVLRTVALQDRYRFVAVALLVQPGKQYGIWETGQEVVALPGVWLGENRASGTVGLSYGDAKGAAADTGRRWLAQHGLVGTVATVVIEADGQAAVFEEF